MNMVSLKRVLLTLLLIFSFSMAFAEPPFPPPPGTEFQKPDMTHKNFRGKRLCDSDKDFSAVFLKIFQISDSVVIEIAFTQVIKIESILSDSLLINGNPVKIQQIHFSKSGRRLQFEIAAKDFPLESQNFSLKLQKISSHYGKRMKELEIANCQINTEYKFLSQAETWKKF